jgi:hypothetical protein
MRSEKLVAEAGGHFWNLEEGERPPLEAATKHRLVEDGEDFMRAVVTVIFGVRYVVRRSWLFVVTSVSKKSSYHSKPRSCSHLTRDSSHRNPPLD